VVRAQDGEQGDGDPQQQGDVSVGP
jgi:hypothetical protein